MDVVLVAPQIATNTGNIIRLCANTGAALHLVPPLGFSMDSALLRRAGLDYHDLASVTVHDCLADCLSALNRPDLPGRRLVAFRSQAQTRYDTFAYRAHDVLVFGAEATGLSAAQLAELAPDVALRIPMRPQNRSLNLANAVAVVVYEAWRQQDFAGAAESGTPASGHGLTAETLTQSPTDL